MQEAFEKNIYDKVLEKAWQPLGTFDEHSPLVIRVSDVTEIVKQAVGENDILDYMDKRNRYAESIIGELKAIRDNGWIPVEERLPEESGKYCVTTENIETGDRIEQAAWFAHKDDYDMDESEWRELYGYEKVVAWKKSAPYQPNGE